VGGLGRAEEEEEEEEEVRRCQYRGKCMYGQCKY
jgi:hypothetical protein